MICKNKFETFIRIISVFDSKMLKGLVINLSTGVVPLNELTWASNLGLNIC